MEVQLNFLMMLSYILKNIFNFQKKKSKEAGGQLFSPNPNEFLVYINVITGPYLSDRCSKYFWEPDINFMGRDRENMFNDGKFVVGLWHTHPEKHAKSSFKDKDTCLKHLNLLDQSYQGFLLITVGYEDISVEYLDKTTKQWHKLKEV